jgi:hypothetical protein
MIELALATGRPLSELAGMDDRELATLVDILEARRRGG